MIVYILELPFGFIIYMTIFRAHVNRTACHVACIQLSLANARIIRKVYCSLSTSTYPSTWKKAEVIPLLKDGDHERASNNRPLSLLPVASKICEKVVLIQFNSYLLRNNRLSSHQSGNKKHLNVIHPPKR